MNRAASRKQIPISNEKILQLLVAAYAMELETVQNYIAASVNPDGVRSDVIKKALAADVPTELMHAHQNDWRRRARLARAGKKIRSHCNRPKTAPMWSA